MKRLVCLGLLGACATPEIVDTTAQVEVEERGSRYSSLNTERGAEPGPKYLTSNTNPIEVDNRRASFPLYRRAHRDFLRDVGRVSGSARGNNDWQEDEWLTFVSGSIEYVQDVGHSPRIIYSADFKEDSIQSDKDKIIEVLRLADPGTDVIFHHPHPEPGSPHIEWRVDDTEIDLALPGSMDFFTGTIHGFYYLGATISLGLDQKVPKFRVVTERYVCEYWVSDEMVYETTGWWDTSSRRLEESPIAKAYDQAQLEWCIIEQPNIQAARNIHVGTFIELLARKGLHVKVERNE